MTEKELYPPIHDLFEKLGYKVNAEVRDCDMTAVKDGELIIVELKRNLTVALLAQGIKRLRTGAKVYVAAPKPKQYSFRKLRGTFAVIKKLELGLIFVTLRGEYSFAEIVFPPREFKPTGRNYTMRKEIIKEIEGRTVDTNTGGVTGTKIVTAYTERCIHIACMLDMYGDMTTKEIKAKGGGDNAYGILNRNVFGWFEKIDRFTYRITDKGRRALPEYPELEKYYTNLLRDTNTDSNN